MSKSEDYIKEQLEKLSQDVYERPLNNLSNINRSNCLSRLFVELAMPAIGHVDVSDHYETGFVDGSGDLAIDFIIKVAHDVHIIQTKYRGWNKKLDRDSLDTFHTILNRLTEPSFEPHKNGRLEELSNEIEWEKDNIYLWFVTNVKLDNQAKAATEVDIEIPERLASDFCLSKDRVDCTYIDQQVLYDVLTEVSSMQESSGIDSVDIYATKQKGEEKKGRSELVVVEGGRVKVCSYGY